MKRSGTTKYRPIELCVTEFIRRYLQHVLPSRFHKVRHFGFLSSTSRVPLLLIRWLVAIANDRVIELCHTEVLVSPPRSSLTCAACGGVLVCVEIILPHGSRQPLRRLPDIRTRGSPVAGEASC